MERPIQWVSRAFFSGVNWKNREANNLHPSTEVTNALAFTSLPHKFYGSYLSERRTLLF
jgi:hypothetical protein